MQEVEALVKDKQNMHAQGDRERGSPASHAHSVFTIWLTTQRGEDRFASKLDIVDLAGFAPRCRAIFARLLAS